MTTDRVDRAPARDPMAWAISQRGVAPFGCSLPIQFEGQPGDIASGDGALLTNEVGLIQGIARIYRIRRSIDRLELHFDVIRRLDAPVDVSTVVKIDAPDPIAPIHWDIFSQVVRHCCGDEFEHLPLISAKKDPHEQAHLRELLQLATMDDLLGPAGGPEEQIVGMGVRDRYLVGRLAPKDTSDDGRSAIDPDEQPENSELLIKEGHQDQGDLSGQSGDADPDEQEFDASSNQSLIPSSFGLTCCIDGAADAIEITARWGRYRRTPDEDVKIEGKPDPKTGEKKITQLRTWRREPMGGTLRLALPKGSEQIPKQVIDSDQEQVFVQGAIRKPLPNGDRLLTLFLINGQSVPDENPDEAWVFQPEIRLAGIGDAAPFRRRPVLDAECNDDERLALEMIYRDHVEFAVGHGVSVHAEPSKSQPGAAHSVSTSVMPTYEVPITDIPGHQPEDREAAKSMADPDQGWLDMRRLATLDPEELRTALDTMVSDYQTWIDENRARIGREVQQTKDEAVCAMDRCEAIRKRLSEGLNVLISDADALEAFRFANRVMAEQRVHSILSLLRRRGEKITKQDLNTPKNHSWRPFQLAFMLLSIPALTDPTHPDRTHPIQAHGDLLWFPTGGGKTEAYLGVAAFTMAIRRLKHDLGGMNGGRGLAVIMRYTLRLLTLQQFQRATTLICAMEEERKLNTDRWGKEPFSIGLWVGQKVTPNRTADAAEEIKNIRAGKRGSGSTPAQLTTCPWCGCPISEKEDIEVDTDRLRTRIRCSDPRQDCPFSNGDGLPVLVVDEEIYRRPPTMLIATVDKFAMMAWKGEIRTLFGRATKHCPRHGLVWEGCGCKSRHDADKRKGLEGVVVESITPIRPPDLIIQDEFHLISGPLGTMVGLYETAVDELCSWMMPDGKGASVTVRPKVVASSATVRKAEDQVRNVFLRKVAIFPPHGLDVKDNFFSIQRSTDFRPGRRYVGICAPGSSRPAVLIRVYTALLTAAQELFDHFGEGADPWMTTVGYFNSLRELGGMARLAQDDVQTRCYRVKMSRVERPGLAQRSVKNIEELTSRVSSKEIPRTLDKLEVKAKATYAKNETWATDIVLATNMLSVGVDVNRLGLMAVNGQPKSTAEYIQATSRVGRSFPGLVFSVLTWSRPRDLSHYETFEHYHATFYKHVEAQSVTPFAPRALDRGLTGSLVSMVRLENDPANPNLGASTIRNRSAPEIAHMIEVAALRAERVLGPKPGATYAKGRAGERFDLWVKEAQVPSRTLGYERVRDDGTVVNLLERPGLGAWAWNTTPMSMREVEPGVQLIMDYNPVSADRAWQAAPKDDDKGGR